MSVRVITNNQLREFANISNELLLDLPEEITIEMEYDTGANTWDEAVKDIPFLRHDKLAKEMIPCVIDYYINEISYVELPHKYFYTLPRLH